MTRKGYGQIALVFAISFVALVGVLTYLGVTPENPFSVVDEDDNCQLIPFPEGEEVRYGSLSDVEDELNEEHPDADWKSFKEELNLQMDNGIVVSEKCVS